MRIRCGGYRFSTSEKLRRVTMAEIEVSGWPFQDAETLCEMKEGHFERKRCRVYVVYHDDGR
ncbi:hypothetical protein AKJ43_03355 [candidate division MSBL1 archaeon SCGC-AAA261D19]|uniref:Uncharacterized protein n=1 Tax=candidate division MSBL1 archaeon SCGC-AAA261D19 TaxID=1698273 RepID=A0A133V4X1_9EURY|nr:hypothetical protein AKJ43_03355 [candidate division MSBL1 archaeon SCGC-AAA261D19]